MYDRGAYSHIITNASRSLNYYKRVAPLLTHGAILTFHSDHAKLDKFLEIAALFNPWLLTVYIPMNRAKWDECVEAYEKLTAMGVRAVPKTVFEEFGNGKANIVVYYTKEQRDFIDAAAWKTVNTPVPVVDRETIRPLHLSPKVPAKSNGNYRTIEIFRRDGTLSYTTPQSLIINRQNDFRGFQCNVGLDFLLIGYNGDVFRANCQREVLANIKQTPEFKLPDSPITCNVPLCWCEGDILATKFRS